jgi:hypothetical protein
MQNFTLEREVKKAGEVLHCSAMEEKEEGGGEEEELR